MQHAHERGVIHRDIKPSNILVDGAGQPKILDFGIARAIDQAADRRTLQTMPGQILGTVAYMSPEQAAGEHHRVGTPADVYSIGVVGYELLADALPYPVSGLPVGRALQLVSETEATPLAARDRRFRGDVDTIFQKALQKDPARRYASAAEMARDLRCHLRDEPIQARPPTAIYQLSRFVRRHRGLAAGMLIALGALVAGSVAALASAVEAGRQAELARAESTRARDEARVANSALGFVEQLFSGAAPAVAEGETLTAEDLVERGQHELMTGWSDAPRVHSRLQSFLGGVLQDLGKLDQAGPMIVQSLEEARRSGVAGEALATFVLQAGQLHLATGEWDRAQKEFEETLALLDGHGAPRGTAVAAACGLASIARARENPTRARTWVDGAVRMAEQADDRHSREMALTFAADLYSSLFPDEAEPLWQRLLQAVPLESGSEKAGIVATNLGIFRMQQGRVDEARSLFERALEIGEKLYDAEHPRLIPRLVNLGSLYAMCGQGETDEPLLERAVAIQRASGRPVSLSAARAIQNLGNLRISQGESTEALKLFEQALAAQERLVGRHSATVASTLKSIGAARFARHDYGGAIEALERSSSIFDALAASGARVPDPSWLRETLAKCYRTVGRDPDAAARERAR